jgi:hypothetical protein
MAVQCFMNVGLAGIVRPVQQRRCGDDDPWRAISALGRTFFYENTLNIIVPSIFDQPLDGEDFATRELRDRFHAGQDWLTVGKDGTRAALLESTAKFCPGQAELIA